jgi:nitrogen regulatory protein PII-like uncharacterized protein
MKNHLNYIVIIIVLILTGLLLYYLFQYQKIKSEKFSNFNFSDDYKKFINDPNEIYMSFMRKKDEKKEKIKELDKKLDSIELQLRSLKK